MIQRLARDESGMTMGLAIMMILLISVMGAGLLTFVSRDLNSVIEENRGQRAFEVADAGIEAAKRQLASDVITTDYNDPIVDPPAPVDDIQWSAAHGGLILEDLDDDAATTDSVKVTIEYLGDETEEFRVISEGTYGDPPQQAKRRIEAIFGAADLGISDDDNSARPSYYTPSSILIDGPKVSIKGISMFSRQDILIEDPTPLDPYSAFDFHAEYDSNNGVTLDTIPNPREELCDWNSAVRMNPPCFDDSELENYNTVSRMKDGSNYGKVGFAAEGELCGYPDTGSPTAVPPFGTCEAAGAGSAADGVYGYDSTTGADKDGIDGNNLTFVAKEELDPPLNPRTDANLPGTITYPFPRFRPKPEAFKQRAQFPDVENDETGAYWPGPPTDASWGLSPGSEGKVVFVDAGNQTLTFDPDLDPNPTAGGAEYKGIIIVWCGELQLNQNFRGIILNLYGDDLPGNTQCGNHEDGPVGNVGLFTNNGNSCKCWVYAEGGTSTRAGIVLRPGSSADFLPAGIWSNLPADAFVGPLPTDFVLQRWRELYE
jgi:hypothetical protein